ncbi:MAG: tRNA lysidine(34) synthetase TilS [Oligoflexia bacterium]|nr:tRNA lysidine(34) synthetase TilS [Oligoflexia bacterium]
MKETEIFEFINRHKLITAGDKILVAVSGGIDSIVLLDIIRKYANMLNMEAPVVAHLNHQLRGKESDRDETFVIETARENRLEVVSRKADIKELGRKSRTSVQEAARKYRLGFLEEVAEKYSCTKIATGHNRNDLAETSLMWILRGTGPNGATGIQPKRENYIRPLLAWSRKTIEEYAALNNLVYVEDSSNEKTDYVRNRIRNEILPLIEEKCYYGATENISRFAEILRYDVDYIEGKTDEIYDSICAGSDEYIVIDTDKLSGLDRALSGRIIRRAISHLSTGLRDIGQVHIEQVLDLCAAQNKGQKNLVLPGNIKITRSYSNLVIKKHDESVNDESGDANTKKYVLEYPGNTEIPELGIIIGLSLLPGKANIERYTFENPDTVFLNFDKITLPLELRLPRKGDRFTPLGTAGSKKLSDFFIDSKIPFNERWRIPVIEDKNNILWVVGHRISEHYRINYECRNVLMVSASSI